MLASAKDREFAFPAINVSSSQTLNAALAGFAEAESDGIIQVTTGEESISLANIESIRLRGPSPWPLLQPR